MSFIVAIAGGSGAGKSTIAAALAERLGARAALIAEDDYYICRTAFAAFEETTHDFDRPEAKDHALLAAHLAHARRGEAFEKPVYRHADHRRAGFETFAPNGVLILEGLHAFATPTLRETIDLAVYIEADEALAYLRREARDVLHRGRTRESVRAQWEATVLPAYRETVAPQRASADLVLVSTAAGGVREAQAHAEAILALVP